MRDVLAPAMWQRGSRKNLKTERATDTRQYVSRLHQHYMQAVCLPHAPITYVSITVYVFVRLTFLSYNFPYLANNLPRYSRDQRSIRPWSAHNCEVMIVTDWDPWGLACWYTIGHSTATVSLARIGLRLLLVARGPRRPGIQDACFRDTIITRGFSGAPRPSADRSIKGRVPGAQSRSSLDIWCWFCTLIWSGIPHVSKEHHTRVAFLHLIRSISWHFLAIEMY